MREALYDTGTRCGIDIGRVILAEATDKSDSLFSRENYHNASFNPGAFEAMRLIVDMVGESSVFLVSKCSPIIQDRTSEVLRNNNFFKTTGVSEDNVYFCEKRSQKAEIAHRLNLTHFVDDRLGVLHSMPDSVEYRFLFSADYNQPFPYEVMRSKSTIYPVRGWQSAVLAIEQSIAK